jgi:aspartate 1-decarboxylase
MFRLMLRSKIHRATVTDANLEYEGSLTVDPVLLDAASILPYELVHVSNLNNGERFETYVIPGKRGSGEMVLNGPTARRGVKGDKIIVFCYEYFNEEELKTFNPRIILVDENNGMKEKYELYQRTIHELHDM